MSGKIELWETWILRKDTDLKTCVFFVKRFSSSIKGQIMARGTVKWFDNRRGFGFIAQDTGLDIFVHHSNINEKGFKKLHEGDIVSYNLISTDKGPKAEGVERVVGGK